MPTDKQQENQNNSKKKILILSDEFGRNVNKNVMHRIDSLNFKVETVIKPGADFQKVIEDIEALTSTYSPQDHVIIIAGSNNFNTHKKYPLFRDICDKIKKCTNLNVTLATVAYGRNYYTNKFIFKFNEKLKEFATKLNHYVPGNIAILDVNKGFKQSLTKSEISGEIVKIVKTKKEPKNLIFVNLTNSVVSDNPPIIEIDDGAPQVCARENDVATSLLEEISMATLDSSNSDVISSDVNSVNKDCANVYDPDIWPDGAAVRRFTLCPFRDRNFQLAASEENKYP